MTLDPGVSDVSSDGSEGLADAAGVGVRLTEVLLRREVRPTEVEAHSELEETVEVGEVERVGWGEVEGHEGFGRVRDEGREDLAEVQRLTARLAELERSRLAGAGAGKKVKKEKEDVKPLVFDSTGAIVIDD